MKQLEKVLVKLAKALERADPHARFMVIGGQAVLRVGQPRVTRDIDITLDKAPADLGPVLAAVQKAGFVVLADDVTRFVASTHVLPLELPGMSLRVDLILGDSAYEKTAIDRADRVDVAGHPVRFATAEDLIIHKLIAGRPRDIEDVRGILVRQHRLDAGYIETWLADFAATLDRPLLEAWRTVRSSV